MNGKADISCSLTIRGNRMETGELRLSVLSAKLKCKSCRQLITDINTSSHEGWHYAALDEICENCGTVQRLDGPSEMSPPTKIIVFVIIVLVIAVISFWK